MQVVAQASGIPALKLRKALDAFGGGEDERLHALPLVEVEVLVKLEEFGFWEGVDFLFGPPLLQLTQVLLLDGLLGAEGAATVHVAITVLHVVVAHHFVVPARDLLVLQGHLRTHELGAGGGFLAAWLPRQIVQVDSLAGSLPASQPKVCHNHLQSIRCEGSLRLRHVAKGHRGSSRRVIEYYGQLHDTELVATAVRLKVKDSHSIKLATRGRFEQLEGGQTYGLPGYEYACF